MQRTKWTCDSCGNLNWEYRDVCNRCPRTREQNEAGRGRRAEENENKEEGGGEDARGLIGRKRHRLELSSHSEQPSPRSSEGLDFEQQMANLRAQLELRDDELRSERQRNSDLVARLTRLQGDIEDLEDRQRARAKQHADDLATERQEAERIWSRRLEDAESESDRMRQVARRRQEDLDASEAECERLRQRLRADRGDGRIGSGGGGGLQEEYDRGWQGPRSRSRSPPRRSRSRSPPQRFRSPPQRSPPGGTGWDGERGDARHGLTQGYEGDVSDGRQGSGDTFGGASIYRRVDNGSVAIDSERVNRLILNRDGFRRQKNWAEADHLQKELLAMVHCTP